MELYIVLAVIVVVAAILILRRKKGAEEVPQGLQVFDENGNVVVDTSERITKYLGSFTVPTDADSGTVANSEIGDGDLWYAMVIDSSTPGSVPTGGDVIYSYPVITKGDGVLYWNYPHSQTSYYKRYGVTIHYGVY